MQSPTTSETCAADAAPAAAGTTVLEFPLASVRETAVEEMAAV